MRLFIRYEKGSLIGSEKRLSLKVLNVRRLLMRCEKQVRTKWVLKDMFQLIGMPQGIEQVTLQLKDTPTKVYAIGARMFLLKVPLEVLQNWVLIQLKDTPHIFESVQWV